CARISYSSWHNFDYW
nr:immunoglobulin heavy chain junction region [Macaca mulatta]MOW22837.1 immunoglobulin heavy chain junction region [Macaca mulatta]